MAAVPTILDRSHSVVLDSPPTPTPTGYIPALDGLRCLAVLLVVISHGAKQLPIPGRFGVTIFFFLSGFLITTLLIRERDETGSVDLQAFWARRLLRLMPPLLVVLAVIYVANAVGAVPGTASGSGVLSQVFYFANYHLIFFDGVAAIPDGTVVFWSLAVEEHFYLLYPILFAALAGARHRRVTRALFGICILVLLWRTALIVGGASDFRVNLATDTRIDSIAYGCLFALLWNPTHEENRSGDPAPGFARDLALAALGGLAILVTLTLGGLDTTPGWSIEKVAYSVRYSVQGIALMPIFRLAILHHRRFGLRILESPLFRLIGRYSYTIYLTHYTIVFALQQAGVTNTAALLLGTITYSLWAGYLIDQLIDRPLGGLRRTFRHDSRPAISPATV